MHVSQPNADWDTPTNIEVSVVIPCLNEVATIGACVDKALDTLREHGLTGEVVVGDNGSSDDSARIATQRGARVINVPIKGYGAAVSGAVKVARGRYIVMGDADCSYDFGELFKFVEKLHAGADFVMGCRLPRGGGKIMPGSMPFLHRWLGTPVLTRISRLFFHSRVTDINCGMRGFRRQAFVYIERLDYFNLVGALGWWWKGKVLKERTQSDTNYSLMNRLIPVLRPLEKFWNPPFGLSLIVVVRRFRPDG